MAQYDELMLVERKADERNFVERIGRSDCKAFERNLLSALGAVNACVWAQFVERNEPKVAQHDELMLVERKAGERNFVERSIAQWGLSG